MIQDQGEIEMLHVEGVCFACRLEVPHVRLEVQQLQRELVLRSSPGQHNSEGNKVKGRGPT